MVFANNRFRHRSPVENLAWILGMTAGKGQTDVSQDNVALARTAIVRVASGQSLDLPTAISTAPVAIQDDDFIKNHEALSRSKS